MSCYVRHLEPMFELLDLDFSDKSVRKMVDKAVRKVLKMDDAQCNEVWAEIKKRGIDNKDLIALVRKALN